MIMTKTKLPPEASRAGKNKYYHQCNAVGTSRHYGICLFTIEAFERGQELMETPCVEAMKSGACPAMKMREEERQAGEALYFKEPDPEKAVNPVAAQNERNSVSKNHPSYQRGYSGAVWGGEESKNKAKAKTPPKPVPKQRNPEEMIEFDSSKIVNSLINTPDTPHRGLGELKDEMLEVSRPAALRRKKAIDAGEEVKPSIFDYMTNEETRLLKKLKAEVDKIRKQQETV